MGYSRTQWGRWYLLIPFPAVLITVIEAIAPGPPLPWWVYTITTGIMAAAILSFCSLTIRDEGDVLRIRFGPIPLLRMRIRYADIVSAEPDRTSFLDGWGLHYNAFKGTIVNVWGYDCVRIQTKRRVYWIGTDDPEGLCGWIRQKAADLSRHSTPTV
ncbi:hypothetical protein [Thermopirellula anaerolimosa]